MNALCNRLCMKSREVAASLPGQFLSRLVSHCVQQWKLNLELRGSTKATTVVVAKITGERGFRAEKSVFVSFSGWPEDREFVRKKMRFGASYSTSNKLLLVARHILITGLKKCL